MESNVEAHEESVDEILKRISEMASESLDIISDNSKLFIEKVHAYLHCREQMDLKYKELDELQDIAQFQLEDDSGGMRLESGNYKTEYLQQTVDGNTVQNIQELYEAAERTLPVLRDTMEKFIERVREVTPDENSGDIAVIVPGLKGRERTIQKANDDYSNRVPGPGIAYVNDIVRGCVLFQSKEQLLMFVQLIKEDPSIHVVKGKNRFRNPTLTGYRDFNIQFQVTMEGFKHTCEIQVHHKEIKLLSKELKSHEHYEFFRVYYAGATGSLEKRLEDLKAIGAGTKVDVGMLEEILTTSDDIDRIQRLGVLFDNYLKEPRLAIKVYARLLELEKEAHGETDLRLANYYNRIAQLLITLGKFDDAMKVIEKALEIARINHKEESSDVATSYTHLGRLAKQQGKLDYAKEMFERALAIDINLYGMANPNVASDYTDIGRVANDQGNLDYAKEMFEKALAIRIQAYGPDSPAVSIDYTYVGRVAKEQGDIEKAIDMFAKALEIDVEVYGRANANVATDYMDIGRMAMDRGKLEYAEKMFQKSYSINLQVFGEENQQVAISQTELGRLAQFQGRLDDAKVMFEKALDIDLAIYGRRGNNKHAAIHYVDLGRLALDQEDLQSAKDMLEKAAKIFSHILGEDHLYVGIANQYLGILRSHEGNFVEAHALCDKALKAHVNVLGEEHSRVGTVYNSYGLVYAKEGNLESAKEMFEKALSIRKKTLNENHFEVANTCMHLGGILEGLEDWKRAKDVYSKALSIRKQCFGEDHGLVMEAGAKYASVSQKMEINTLVKAIRASIVSE